MKSSWVGIIFLINMLFSCGGAMTKRTVTLFSPSAEKHQQDVLVQKDDPMYLRGGAKIQENDCPSCHARERKSVGPSYEAVAARYEATEEVIGMLAKRIITGSVGNWGKIPMTAHPQLTQEDAEQMVKFVLTIKN